MTSHRTSAWAARTIWKTHIDGIPRGRLLAWSVGALVLVGCGGGGGSSGGQGTPPGTPAYSISGAVTGAISAGVTVSLSGPATASTTTDASGAFSFAGLPSGGYTVTPSRAAYEFSPSSLLVAVSGSNVSGRDFTASLCVQTLRVYWTPGMTGPVAGFTVPGLAAAGFPPQLDCPAAGLSLPGSRVEVRVNGVTLSCRYPDPCVGTDWQCPTGGVQVTGGYPLQPVSNMVEIFGYSDAPSAQSMTYYGRLDQPASCGLTTVGVVSAGLAGTLGMAYAFTPFANCHPATNISWDLRAGTAGGAVYDTGSVACGSTNPFEVTGGLQVPAGVYTLVNVAERDASTSWHAFCSTTPFVHAGDEILQVDLPASTATCN